MFGLIRSLFRLATAGFYYLTFRVDKAQEVLLKNPGVVKATFEAAIDEKRSRIKALTSAISTEVAQEEMKLSQLQTVDADIERLKKVKDGALTMAQKRVQKLQTSGVSSEDIEKDPEVLKCRAAYQDSSSTLKEKEYRKKELEDDLKEKGARIAKGKLELSRRMKEIEKLRQESAETITDILSAEDERKAYDIINDVADDATEESLRKVREIRVQTKAKARVAREVSQAKDTKSQEDEFLRYAQETSTNDDFSRLVGLTKLDAEKEAPVETTLTEKASTQLPE